jgi:hypothetical protein
VEVKQSQIGHVDWRRVVSLSLGLPEVAPFVQIVTEVSGQHDGED